jgi:hypothetical protein
MQHAGVAATALITALAVISDPEKRYSAMRHLLFMSTILQELAYSYRHALRMCKVVETVLKQTEWDDEYRRLEQRFKPEQENGLHIPARRDSSNVENTTEARFMNKRSKFGQFRSPELDARSQSEAISATPRRGSTDDNINTFLNNMNAQSTQHSCPQASSSRSNVHECSTFHGTNSSSGAQSEGQQWSESALFTEKFDSFLGDWEQLSGRPETAETEEYHFPFPFIK